MNENQKQEHTQLIIDKIVSLHEVQERFLLSHAHGILNDEELLLIYEEYWPKNPDCFGRFSLEGFLSTT